MRYIKRQQNVHKSIEAEDNENANYQGVTNKKTSGGGDAYTKMVTKVEKIKVYLTHTS